MGHRRHVLFVIDLLHILQLSMYFMPLHYPAPQILNHSPRNFQKSLYLQFEYFRYPQTGFDVFLTLIPNHPTWRRVIMQPWGVIGEKLLFMWSRDQCLAIQAFTKSLASEQSRDITLAAPEPCIHLVDCQFYNYVRERSERWYQQVRLRRFPLIQC